MHIHRYRLLADFPSLIHGVTDRRGCRQRGGCSVGPFEALNLSFHVGDDVRAVLRNRAAVAQALGVSPGDFVTARQPHGTEVAVVTEADRGRGALDAETEFVDADALVTNQPGPVLMCFSADCPSLLLFDPVETVVAVAHSGWRGTVADITTKTIRRMSDQYGCRPRDILACIGPGIHACCFAVGPEVVDSIRSQMPLISDCIDTDADRSRLSLHDAIRMQLLHAGIDQARIEAHNICTACRTDLYYSYRAEGGTTGRFATVACLR